MSPETAPVSAGSRVIALLRSNASLALLLVIAVSIFFIAFGRRDWSPQPDASALAGGGSDSAYALDSDGTLRRQAEPRYELKDMPAPSTFRSFTPARGDTLALSGTCKDRYRVVMIFPATADYRADPALANYNSAESCVAGGEYSETVRLDDLRLNGSSTYYLIEAFSGPSGNWYDPH